MLFCIIILSDCTSFYISKSRSRWLPLPCHYLLFLRGQCTFLCYNQGSSFTATFCSLRFLDLYPYCWHVLYSIIWSSGTLIGFPELNYSSVLAMSASFHSIKVITSRKFRCSQKFSYHLSPCPISLKAWKIRHEVPQRM